jgi:pimeloyl-ACP methyl ester carboxylesterase
MFETVSMTRVLVVPGLAVRTYLERSVAHLRQGGYDARLLPAPGWRGVEDDVERYGRALGADVDRAGSPVSVLVGLSIGTQAAAVAAASTPLIKRLVLISSTIDPQYRTPLKQFVVFAKGNPHERFRTVRQMPDWSRAGPVRIIRCFRSAIALPLEDVLPQVSAEITIIHTEYDPLTSHAYAASLAADNGAQLVLMPGASHSWPKDDPPGFLQFMDGRVRAVHDGMAT